MQRKTERDVAQSGLEYSSGGRVVASSNLVIPTKALHFVQRFFVQEKMKVFFEHIVKNEYICKKQIEFNPKQTIFYL